MSTHIEDPLGRTPERIERERAEIREAIHDGGPPRCDPYADDFVVRDLRPGRADARAGIGVPRDHLGRTPDQAARERRDFERRFQRGFTDRRAFELAEIDDAIRRAEARHEEALRDQRLHGDCL